MSPYRTDCNSCGRQISMGALYCPHCGVDRDAEDDLAYGGVCPVCDNGFVDGFSDLEQGESVDGARVCIVDKGADEGEALIHLPETHDSDTDQGGEQA